MGNLPEYLVIRKRLTAYGDVNASVVFPFCISTIRLPRTQVLRELLGNANCHGPPVLSKIRREHRVPLEWIRFLNQVLEHEITRCRIVVDLAAEMLCQQVLTGVGVVETESF